MSFSVSSLPDTIRLYQLQYPIYSPRMLCSTMVGNEYTIYKYTGEDDILFESLSIQFDPRIYHVFSLHEDCPGISHVGIIHFISGLFTKANIPILYITTYSLNLVLVSGEYKENAMEIMRNHPRILFE